MRVLRFVVQCLWASVIFIRQSLWAIIIFIALFLWAIVRLILSCLWILTRIIVLLFWLLLRLIVRYFRIILSALVYAFFLWQTGWNGAVAIVTIEIGLFLFLWFRYRRFRNFFGEGKVHRTRLNYIINYFTLIIFLGPIVFYYFKSTLIQSDQIPQIAQLSVLGISGVLAGISLAASRISNIAPNKKLELICVSQKFILVIVFYIIFFVALFMVDNVLNGINVNSITISSPEDIYRGILFYLSVPSFYSSFILFLVGLVDLVFAFSDLDTRPTIPR